MTPTPTPQAGRELDQRIGREVLGYTVFCYDRGGTGEGPTGEDSWMLVDRDDAPVLLWAMPYRSYMERASEAAAWEDCPHFSTDIAAAWTLVEGLAAQDWTLKLQWKGADRESAHSAEAAFIRDFDAPHAYADTAPLAIALAALRTVEYSKYPRPRRTLGTG